MGFPRQEHWRGLPFPSPGDLPNPGIEPASPASAALQAESLPLSHWEALDYTGADALVLLVSIACVGHCSKPFHPLPTPSKGHPIILP